MSLSRKVRVGAGTIGAIFVVQAGITAFAEVRMGSINDQQRLMGEALHNHMQADMDHDAIRSSVFRALHGAARGDRSEISTAAGEIDEFGKDLDQALNANRTLPLDDDIRARLARIQDQFAGYVKSARDLTAAASRDPAAAEAMLSDFDRRFRALEEAQEQLSQRLTAQFAAVDEAAASIARVSLWLLLLSTGLMAAALIWAVRQLGRSVIRPIDEIAKGLDHLSNGDLTHAIRSGSSDAEMVAIERAAEAFRAAGVDRERTQAVQNEVVERLGSALTVLAEGDLTQRIDQPFAAEYESLRQAYNASVARLSNLLGQVIGSAETVATGAGEIQAASNDLASRNERQAASVEETAAAMKAITADLRTMAGTVGEVQGAVGLSNRQATEGGDVVREAIGAMASIEQSSQEISQIVGVLDGIAFQTNLLALNAGVEAARAGEAGKGFAVVANEVRALAQRSAESASEIKLLIGKATDQVHSGVSMVDRTGNVLASIIEGMGGIDQWFSEIAGRTERQATNMQNINQAVTEMDRMTQQNAAMVEQSTASSRALAAEANRLKGLVAQFRTEHGAPRPQPVVAAAVPRLTPARARPAIVSRGALAVAGGDDWAEF